MKIKILEKHKSINPCEFDIPSFSVLTGTNGSGKTHLLEVIANNTKSIITLNNNPVKNIRYIGFNQLNASIIENASPKSITDQINSHWKTFNHALNTSSHNNNETLFKHMNNVSLQKFILKIIEKNNKTIDTITEDDFRNNSNILFENNNDLFVAQFALIFKDYAIRKEENDYIEFRHAKNLDLSTPSLNNEDFEKKFGKPPWELVNKILNEIKIPYEVNNPTGDRRDSKFIFKLKDKNNNLEISPIDLSTGEKVLMSLALAIYNSSSGVLNKPDILLLDEPDASLHPSMSKMMVDILNNYIVIDNKIPVIISTHSPTTIMASEGIEIYQITKGSSTPNKISTEDAVKILSSNMPFLKILNEKRRVVFVESKYDAHNYASLTDIYRRIEPDQLKVEPIYLATKQNNSSNCNDVISIVDKLYKNGYDQVYGIIDRDINNTTKNNLIILGENERYAIENYLLDPLLMSLLLLKDNKLQFSNFKLNNTYSSYIDLGNLDQSDAQKLIDKVLNYLSLASGNIVSYKLQNEWTLNISKDFNEYKGHELEDLYKSKYEYLANSYKGENDLKRGIIEKVINDYPKFAPKKIFETILKIK